MDRPKASAEDELIARYFRPLATHPGALDLTDDAAVFNPPAGSDLVLKTDAVISGVHFFPEDPAAAIARKALRVNLSDLAAKGAVPAGFLLSLALPAGTSDDWLREFAEGLRADAERYTCPLLGGDTLHFDIVAVQSARALMDLAVAQRLPVGNGIITVDTEAQAWTRAKPDEADKGGDAARAALAMLRIKRRLLSRERPS